MNVLNKLSLGELTQNTRPICYGVLKPGPNIEDGVPLVRIVDITGNELCTSRMHRISNELDNEFSRSRLNGGEVLISIQGTIGKVAVVPVSAAGANISRTIAVISPDARCYPRYLYWYLRNLADADDFRTVGSTRTSLNISALRETQVPLPPLEEQKRIAGILDQADALRRLRSRALDKLNTLGQAIFHEMFGESNSENDNITLGEICDVRDGTHDSPKYVESGYPLLTSKNFSSGSLSYHGAKMISPEDYEKINKRSKVDVGDIVMPMIGTIGSPVIIEQEPNFAIKNVALIKFLDNSPKASFVHALLSGPYLDRIVKTQGRGGTQKFVSLGDLRKLSFPSPSRTKQVHFDTVMGGIRSQVAVLERALHSQNALFDSLQYRAFRGEL